MKAENRGFSTILVVVLLLLLGVAAVGGAYYFDKTGVPLSLPTSGPVATSTAGLTPNWKTQTLDGKASFQYPPTWQYMVTAPQEYANAFLGHGADTDCSHGYLQDANDRDNIIAIEFGDQDLGEGGYCWSIGEFGQHYERIITPLNATITVSWWKDANGWIESYRFTNKNKNASAEFALIQRIQRGQAEGVFDKILSTFEFID